MQEVCSGEGDVYYVEFCRRAARLLYHRVLESMGGLGLDISHVNVYSFVIIDYNR